MRLVVFRRHLVARRELHLLYFHLHRLSRSPYARAFARRQCAWCASRGILRLDFFVVSPGLPGFGIVGFFLCGVVAPLLPAPRRLLLIVFRAVSWFCFDIR